MRQAEESLASRAADGLPGLPCPSKIRRVDHGIGAIEAGKAQDQALQHLQQARRCKQDSRAQKILKKETKKKKRAAAAAAKQEEGNNTVENDDPDVVTAAAGSSDAATAPEAGAANGGDGPAVVCGRDGVKTRGLSGALRFEGVMRAEGYDKRERRTLSTTSLVPWTLPGRTCP